MKMSLDDDVSAEVENDPRNRGYNAKAVLPKSHHLPSPQDGGVLKNHFSVLGEGSGGCRTLAVR